jgi:hypothetical protein
MAAGTLTLATVVFGLALWLGLYLISRDPASLVLRLAGLGLVAYALVWALDSVLAIDGVPDRVARLRWPLQFVPALCWTGALLALLPDDLPARTRLLRFWRLYAPIVGVLILLAGVSGLLFDSPGGGLRPGGVLAGCAVLVPLLLAAGLLWRVRGIARPLAPNGLLLVALLFFTLSTGALVFQPLGLPRLWALLLVDGDLVLLGLAIAALDAFDQGEALRPDLLLAFTFATALATLFGGQVAVAIALGPGPTAPMVALLFATVATAIATQTFADQIGGGLDRLAFGRLPGVRAARAELRATASALPRAADAPDPTTLDEAEFARLTRRALGHFGDLPRLAASPLASLPVITARLVARRAPDDALERAAELKALLAESIARLKPRTPGAGDFGTSDEWRYYNALYFPYIVGLKPYSSRAPGTTTDPAARAALAWFQANVPERTLHNWQNAAAKLVAQDLRARCGDRGG